MTRIDEAQRMAGKLNQDANALAADAAKTINDVLRGTTAPSRACRKIVVKGT